MLLQVLYSIYSTFLIIDINKTDFRHGSAQKQWEETEMEIIDKEKEREKYEKTPAGRRKNLLKALVIIGVFIALFILNYLLESPPL